MIESDIIDFFQADTEVKAAIKAFDVGKTPSSTTYPIAGVYRSAENEPEPFAKIQDLIISIKACHSSYVLAHTASKLMKSKLKGYKGKMGNSQIVHTTTPDSVPLYDDTLKRWEVTQDYHIRVRS